MRKKTITVHRLNLDGSWTKRELESHIFSPEQDEEIFQVSQYPEIQAMSVFLKEKSK